MENFTKEQLAQMKEAFLEIDRSGTGKMSIQDLQRFMKPLGKDTSEREARIKRELEDIMPMIDKSGDGYLDFTEFAMLMADEIKDEHYEEEIGKAFEHIVKKKTNNITKKDMRRIYKLLDEQVTEDELTAVFKKLEVEGNEMTFNDFLRIMYEV